MTNKITSEDVYTQEVGDLYDEAGLSKGPRRRDYILDLVKEHGINGQSLVLDVGCANGGLSRKLIDKTGCKIEGIDVVPFLVDLGEKENRKLDYTDKFTIQQGSITDIPFDDNAFDFVFCNDVIGLVGDLPKAMRECTRVLKPNGKIFMYASFATDRLSDKEAKELKDSLGGSEKGQDENYTRECLEKELKIVYEKAFGSEFTLRDSEDKKDKSQAAADLNKVARLLTHKDEYIKKYGQKVYKIVLAEVQWSPFILLGKLKPTIFIAQKSD